MRKLFCLVLSLILLCPAIPAYAAETSQISQQSDQALMDAYARIIEYADERAVPTGMSLDVFTDLFKNGQYQDLTDYEQKTKEAIDELSIEEATISNYLDKSPLEIVSGENNSVDFEPTDAENTADVESAEPPRDASIDSLLSESHQRVLQYIAENGIEATISLENYISEYYSLGYDDVDDYEELYYSFLAPSVSTYASNLPYFNNTGLNCPASASYSRYGLLANVNKGDVMHEGAGSIGSVIGHTAIVEGKFYDTTRDKFYIRLVEAVSVGVTRGILDDTRVDQMNVKMMKVSGASLAQKDWAIKFCLSQLNKAWVYDAGHNTSGSELSWYCSELVWASYKNQGIDIEGGNLPGVMPADIVASSRTVEYAIGSSTRPSNRLTDIPNDWSRNGIVFAADNGLLMGTSTTKFSPKTNLTRGMAVVVLHRLEGQPRTGSHIFSDISSETVDEAVAWAYNNLIVSGYGDEWGIFKPDQAVTRQELASMLYEYAKYKGYSTTYTDSALNKFTDKGEVMSYAQRAMKWAVTKGLINGRTDTTIVPRGTTTRAEAATIIKRFVDNLVR